MIIFTYYSPINCGLCLVFVVLYYVFQRSLFSFCTTFVLRLPLKIILLILLFLYRLAAKFWRTAKRGNVLPKWTDVTMNWLMGVIKVLTRNKGPKHIQQIRTMSSGSVRSWTSKNFDF